MTNDVNIQKNRAFEISLPENTTIDGCFHRLILDSYYSETASSYGNNAAEQRNYGTITAAGNAYFGGLVAVNEGTIRRVKLVLPEETINIKGDWNKEEGAVTLYAGAMAGWNKGRIEECEITLSKEKEYNIYNDIIGNYIPFEVACSGADVQGQGTAKCGIKKIYLGGIVGQNSGKLINIDATSDFYMTEAGRSKCNDISYGAAVGMSEAGSIYENVMVSVLNSRQTNFSDAGLSILTSKQIFSSSGSGQFSGLNIASVASEQSRCAVDDTSTPSLVSVCGSCAQENMRPQIFESHLANNANSRLEAYWSLEKCSLAGFCKGWRRTWGRNDNDFYLEWKSVEGKEGIELALPYLSDGDNYNYIMDVMDVNAFFPGDNWAKDFMANPTIYIGERFSPTSIKSEYQCLIPILRSGWTLDCQGNLYHYSMPIVGLVEEGATVKNFFARTAIAFSDYSMDLESVVGPAYSDGAIAIGTIANVNRGTIENCSVAGVLAPIIVPTMVYERGKGFQIGALVGRNEGRISSCVSTATISFTSMNVSVLGPQSEPQPIDIGGLVGRNSGDVRDCFVHTDAVFNIDYEQPDKRKAYVLIDINELCDDDDFSFLTAEDISKRNVGKVIGNNTNGTVSHVYHTTVSNVMDHACDITIVKHNNYVFKYSGQDTKNSSFNTSNVHVDGNPWSLYVPTYRKIDFSSAESENQISAINEEANRTTGYFNTTSSILDFENPTRWKPSAFDFKSIHPEQIEIFENLSYFSYFDAPEAFRLIPELTFSSTVCTMEKDNDGNISTEIEISEAIDAQVVSEHIATANEFYGGATVTMTNDIDFNTALEFEEELPWDEETTVGDVSTIPSFGTEKAPFNGTFNGNGNVLDGVQGTFGSGTLFETGKDKGKKANIQNLTVKGRIYVDIAPYVQIAEENNCDTIYVPIIANKLNGNISSVNFDGSVFFDNELAGDRIVVLCLVCETTDGSIVEHSFIYLFNDEGYNKSMERINYNAGVGKGNAKKTATSLADPNKSETSSDRTSNSEAFSKEEFALGVASFWLNCTGTGYTGPYQPLYSVDRATGRPVMANEQNKAIERLVCQASGLETGEKVEDMVHCGTFYKLEEQVEVSFSGRIPSKVTVAGKKVDIFDTKASFSMPVCDANGDVLLHVFYGTMGIEEIVADSREAAIISVSGGIEIRNAKGDIALIYNLDGTMVKSTDQLSDNQKIALPLGIYVVRVGSSSGKVIVKE